MPKYHCPHYTKCLSYVVVLEVLEDNFYVDMKMVKCIAIVVAFFII